MGRPSSQQRLDRPRLPSGLNPGVSFRSPSIFLAMIAPIISCWFALAAATSTTDLPFAQPASETLLLVDHRVPVLVGSNWHIMSEEEHSNHLLARDDNTSNNDLPQPFDGALAANFSGANDGACPAFINTFLQDSTFKSCYPLSLLMQSSYSFFEAQKSMVGITQVLDATCAADVDTCTDYLYNLANELISEDACAEDYDNGNSVVVQSFVAFQSYSTVYSASCLTDADTSSYCYAEAVTDLNSSDNARLYYLPLNISMSSSEDFNCDKCTSQTMEVYQPATANRTSYISNTYVSAAQQVNAACGTNFVNATLPPAAENAAVSMNGLAFAPLASLTLFVVALSQLL